jgi:hypothetical protein
MKKAPTLPLAPAQAGAQFFSKALDSRSLLRQSEAALASRRRAALVSKPTTRQPARAKFLAKAPPMMPSPITPTVPFDFRAIPIFLMMKIAT